MSERTSKRVASKASRLLRSSKNKNVRSVAASALRARERAGKRIARKRG